MFATCIAYWHRRDVRLRFRRLRRSSLARIVALFFVLGSVPGIEEFCEDAAHYVVDGHTAHDKGHESEQPGHCCSGLFHLCVCHPHVSGLTPELYAWVPASFVIDVQWAVVTSVVRLPGHRTRLYRPPTA